ncbi:hypothetical protein Tco_1187897 [Tanacetum coccineum]
MEILSEVIKVEDLERYGEELARIYFVEPKEDHTFEVEPHGNVDHVVGSQEVQTQDLIYYHPARDREQHSSWELFSYREDSDEAAFAVAAVEKIYAHESLTFNNTVACEAEILATKGLLDKAKGNVLGMKIVKDQSGNTLRVSQSRKLRRYDACHMMALSPTEAVVYDTLRRLLLKEAEAIWLKGLAIESGFELKIVAGIATGALLKAVPRSRFQHRLKLLHIEDF